MDFSNMQNTKKKNHALVSSAYIIGDTIGKRVAKRLKGDA